jgi:predicted nucleic acid-binding protein
VGRGRPTCSTSDAGSGGETQPELSIESVLDTFAIVALIRAEHGADQVRALLERARPGEVTCRFSAINVGEVAHIVERRSGLASAQQFLATPRHTPVIVEEATWERILAAARVKAQSTLSYADAFAVALAQEHKATLVTGDPELGSVAQLRVEWLEQ